jgi:hypothetical protein
LFEWHIFQDISIYLNWDYCIQIKKIHRKSEKCFVRDYQTTNSVFHHLTLDDFEGDFFILKSGCAISLFFFIAELVIRCKDIMRNFFSFLLLLTAFYRKILALVFKHSLSYIWLKMKDFFK